tara:strand:- start:187 stop:501 length:315 start_codon:yes stop_codon:yes gene_type:complete
MIMKYECTTLSKDYAVIIEFTEEMKESSNSPYTTRPGRRAKKALVKLQKDGQPIEDHRLAKTNDGKLIFKEGKKCLIDLVITDNKVWDFKRNRECVNLYVAEVC